jgi:hypothetical protein
MSITLNRNDFGINASMAVETGRLSPAEVASAVE